MVRLFGTLCLVLVAAGCGRNIQPLSTQQEHRFKAAMASIGNSIQAVQDASAEQTVASSSNSKRSPETSRMAQILREAKAKGDCVIQSTAPQVHSGGATMTMSGYNIMVLGENCPISLEAKMVVPEGQTTGMSGMFSLKYQAKDSEFEELSQIKSADLYGTMRIWASGNGGTDFAQNMEMELHGTLESVTEGTVDMYFQSGAYMSQRGPNGFRMETELRTGLVFEKFTAEIRGTSSVDMATGKNEASMTLNGRPLSEEEQKTWFGAGGFLPVTAD